jgi:NADH-quinone oxidoreductase subunit N
MWSPRSTATATRSTEAGLKYFVLGALSSGMLLYGASLVYGFTGHTGFMPHRRALPAAAFHRRDLRPGLPDLAGLAFKISAVPFHMWTPDVYEGAPTPGHRLLCCGAKNGGHGAVRARIVGRRLRAGDASNGSRSSSSFHRLHGARRLRRHRPAQHQAPDGLFLDRPYGFALVGLAAGTQAGVQGCVIYMRSMRHDAGAFAIILAMRRKGAMSKRSTIWPGFPRPTRCMATSADHPDVLAGRHSAAGRLLGPNISCSWRPSKPKLYALAIIGVLASWSAPSTTCASSRSCGSSP